MAGTSKLAWGVFRNIGLGSKQFWKTSFCEQGLFKLQTTPIAIRRLYSAAADMGSKLPSPNHGKVSQFLYQWKLGFSGPSTKPSRNNILDRYSINLYHNKTLMTTMRTQNSGERRTFKYPFWSLGQRRCLFSVSPLRLKATAQNRLHSLVRSRLSDVDDIVEASFKKRRISISALAIGLATSVYMSNLETIPYSKRTRLIVMSRQFEKEVGERNWKRFKKKNKDKILSRNHPTSVRVRSIMNKMIEALERGLRDDKVWGGGLTITWHMLFWKHEKESYLDHIHEWEIIVVDNPDINNATCYFGGKIVVYTGLLETLESDAEIATIIGHEVGHGVARHAAELRAWAACLASPGRLLVFLDMAAARKRMQEHSSYLSLSRKLEFEADYIGLLLMASAGYHPSIGLKVRKMRAKSQKHRVESRSTHPIGEKRVQLLAKSQEEAMAFYKESLSIQTPNDKLLNG